MVANKRDSITTIMTVSATDQTYSPDCISHTPTRPTLLAVSATDQLDLLSWLYQPQTNSTYSPGCISHRPTRPTLLAVSATDQTYSPGCISHRPTRPTLLAVSATDQLDLLSWLYQPQTNSTYSPGCISHRPTRPTLLAVSATDQTYSPGCISHTWGRYGHGRESRGTRNITNRCQITIANNIASKSNTTRIAQSDHNVSPFATVEGVAN